MFHRVRKHINPASILALLALVFALTGGAFAASGGGSHATLRATAAKSKGTTGPRGPRGPAGKNGTSGTNGTNGAPGPAGPAGAKGENGAAGATGPQGPAGPEGKGKEGPVGEEGTPGTPGVEGKEGSPWTAGGTLPSGATETGVWTARFPGEVEGAKGIEGNTESAISFTIPLKTPLDAGHVHYANTLVIQEKFGGAPGELCAGLTGTELSSCEANGKAIRTACPGSAIAPTAGVGHLCMYEGAATSKKIVVSEITNPSLSFGSQGAGTAGVVAIVHYPGLPEESVLIQGVWAVTAP